MLQRIEQAANVSVARGCGFAGLAIATMLFALSHDMSLALKTGGALSLLVCLVLVLKAYRVARKPYRRTEVWLMLRPEERPQPAIAQQIISTVLRETYLRFALHAGVSSAVALAMALVVAAAR